MDSLIAAPSPSLTPFRSRFSPIHRATSFSSSHRLLPIPTSPSPSYPTLLRVRTIYPLSFSSSPFPFSKNNKNNNNFNLSPRATPSSSPPPTSSPNAPSTGGGGDGAKLLPLAVSVAVGVLVRFFVPRPVQVSPQAWQLLAIFLSTITGLVLGPLPVGAWAFIALTTSVLTRTLSFSAAFSAFTNEVIWLIVISFFFARGFVKTGLGDRIATFFVKCLGKSTLGLSYGLTLSEALISPAMPSTTARAGGVFLPIIKSLSLSYGSRPGDSSSKKLGSYLIQSQLQVAFITFLLTLRFSLASKKK